MYTNFSLIVGMGATGYSIAKFLRARKMPYLVFDTRNDTGLARRFLDLNPETPVFFEEIPIEIIKQVKQLVVSPGVDLAHPVFQHAHLEAKLITGDIALFLENRPAPVIGVTGSNGKSTVTTLIKLALEAAGKVVKAAGNIGLPALDLLSADKAEALDAVVLELSSFQLDLIQQPNLDVACLLNVSADHMDRYASFDDYIKSKHKIYRYAERIVYNENDHNTTPDFGQLMRAQGFGVASENTLLEEHARGYWYDITDSHIKYHDRLVIHKDEIALKGKHNLENCLAVLTVLKQLGISEHFSLDVFREFRGLPHRCQFIGQLGGVDFINDSKATNVGSTVAAMKGFVSDYEKITLILGGQGKHADFSELAIEINQQACNVILIGDDASLINSFLDDAIHASFADSMEHAVDLAIDQTGKGELVLLSPACASFDMFRSFEHRGDAFIEAVQKRGAVCSVQ